MGAGDGPPNDGPSKESRVLSIVDRIEKKKLDRLRVQSQKLHMRELEATVDWLDTRTQIEASDLDAAIAKLDGVDTEEARRQRGLLRSVRGLQKCFRGDVEAGRTEWARVIEEVPELALPHLLCARWLMQSDPHAALAHYDRAVEVEPRDATVYFRRGDCLLALGEHERALANFRRGSAIDPHSIDGLFATGKALVAVGKCEEAITYYDQAINRAPRYVDFYEARALAFEVTNQLAAAIRDYDRVLSLDPKRTVAKYCRARCRADMGDVDTAIEELSAIATEHSDAGTIHSALGKLYMRQERLSDALESLTRAVEHAPKDHEAFAYRALVNYRLDNSEQALADIARAVEVAPEQPEYLFTHIVLRHGPDQTEARMVALDDAIERFPKSAVFLEERARLVDEQGDHERALVDWDRLIAGWPKDASHHVGRAKALGWMKRYQEALDEISVAIELDPTDGMSYGLRANYRDHLEGDAELVETDWNHASELDPNHIGIRYFRGMYRMALERFDEALEDFDRLVELSPDLAVAYYQRGVCRMNKDDRDIEKEDYDVDRAQEIYEATVNDFERAIVLGYQEEVLYAEMHWFYQGHDDMDAALDSLNQGLEVHPNSGTLYRLRHRLRLQMADAEGAAADLARANELAPEPSATPKAEGEEPSP